MGSLRAFVAVPLAEGVRMALASWQEEVRSRLNGFKWVEPGNLHLTLRFLGDVPEDRIAAVGQALTAAARRLSPFDLGVRGAGAFPRLEEPRVLWAGIEGCPELQALHQAVEAALVEQGWPREERPFRPHLTLARAREPRRRPDVAALMAPVRRRRWGEMMVEGFTLYSSTLTRIGPIYAPLQDFTLQGK